MARRPGGWYRSLMKPLETRMSEPRKPDDEGRQMPKSAMILAVALVLLGTAGSLLISVVLYMKSV